MAEGVALAGTGIVVGLLVAALLTRLLEAQLFGVAPLDAMTFLTAPVLLLLVAAIAAYLPARRAAAVNPMVALMSD
jgi:ABC-type antimicrobial peptide transport system permease subunit